MFYVIAGFQLAIADVLFDNFSQVWQPGISTVRKIAQANTAAGSKGAGGPGHWQESQNGCLPRRMACGEKMFRRFQDKIPLVAGRTRAAGSRGLRTGFEHGLKRRVLVNRLFPPDGNIGVGESGARDYSARLGVC